MTAIKAFCEAVQKELRLRACTDKFVVFPTCEDVDGAWNGETISVALYPEGPFASSNDRLKARPIRAELPVDLLTSEVVRTVGVIRNLPQFEG